MPLVQVSQAQMDLRAQGMVGMEDVGKPRRVLELHMVTCTSLSTLDAEEAAQGDWVEA